MNDLEPKAVTWVITDGRTGILNQARGLAEAVGLPLELKTVHPRLPWTLLPVTLWPVPLRALGPDSASFEPPWPALAIGCGWRAIPFMLEIKRRSNGATFTVQLQDPKISPSYFDLVVPPEHDEFVGPNVVPIIGSPNHITRAKLDEAGRAWSARFQHLPSPRVAVLIGGKSKSHRFTVDDAKRLANQLQELTKSGYAIMATTSRRTGEAQTQIIRQALPQPSAFVWDGAGENPYLGILALAEAILVTSDSTNMAVEAASTGKPVYVVNLPTTNPKFEALHLRLQVLGITRPFAGKIESWTYQPLNETAKIAAIIRKKLNLTPL